MATVTKIQSTISFSDGTQSMFGYVTDTGSNLQTQSQVFAAGSSGASMTMTCTVANLQSFFILANQNCVVKTNSNASPQDTFNLVANVPFFYSKSSGLSAPFAGNVTGAFVTCTPATQIQFGLLQT